MNKDFTIIPGTGIAIYWPDIDKKFKFVAVDYHGQVEAFQLRPYILDDTTDFWMNENGASMDICSTFTVCENWKEMVFERPN